MTTSCSRAALALASGGVNIDCDLCERLGLVFQYNRSTDDRLTLCLTLTLITVTILAW